MGSLKPKAGIATPVVPIVGGKGSIRASAGAGGINVKLSRPPTPQMPLSPITLAKRMNGVRGMKTGGKVKRK